MVYIFFPCLECPVAVTRHVSGFAAGLLLRVPKFSKYLHGVTSLYPNRVDSIPYWFLPADKEGYVMTPATWEEMADPKDPYLKVIA